MVDKEIALLIKERALGVTEVLDGLVYDIRGRCSDEDFQMIKRSVGLTIGWIITEILEPIYKQHPEIDDLLEKE